MASVNELKYAKLFSAAGKPAPATLNELELHWLGTKIGLFTGTLNERWYKEFLLEGVPAGAWNQMAYAYLGIKGATAGTLSERWYEYWRDF